MNNNQTCFMRATFLKRAWRAFGHAYFAPQSRGATLLVAALLAATSLSASPVVTTLGGGNPHVSPKYQGNKNGITLSQALFRTPYGIAVSSDGQKLYVADRDNHAIRKIDLVAGLTSTFIPNPTVPTNKIIRPIGVTIDSSGNMHVLSRGSTNNISTTGTVFEFDTYGNLIATNVMGLTNAAGMALDSVGNIYVTVNSNTLIRISPFISVTNITYVTNITVSSTNIVASTNTGTIQTAATNKTIVATIATAGTSLQGIAIRPDGLIAACDSGRHGILLINPTSGVVTTNTGFNGQGDYTGVNNSGATPATAKFYQPYNVASAGDGSLIVTDRGNHRVKVVNPSGVTTNLYGVTSNYWGGTYPGWYDGTVQVPDSIAPNVQARIPNGVAFAGDGTIYTTEDYYHVIRKVTGAGLPQPPPPPPAAPTILTVVTNYGQVSLTWSSVPGATSYNVKRSQSSGGPYTIIVNTTATSYTDTTVDNGKTYYYVVSALNGSVEGANSPEVSATPPRPPVPDPQIGYVDFPLGTYPFYTSVFHPISEADFYNDTLIIIKGTPNTGTHYTIGYTTNAASVTNPTPSNASIPSDYQDGFYTVAQVMPYVVAQEAPFLTIKAMGEKSGGYPNSAVVSATYQFKTGNPNINGNNAAMFTISDITVNAHLYYTLDGSDPSSTNPAAIDLGTVAPLTNGIDSTTNVWTVSFPIQSDTMFKVRAFRDNFQPSAIVTNIFLSTNFVPNIISFGFAAGEASSVFVASAGQLFYAPVTLTPLAGTTIYSLQFNVTVTNAGPNPGPAITPGAFGFQSMLMQPDPELPGYIMTIPPYMFVGWYTNPIPPGLVITNYAGTNFIDLLTVNTSLNLLGVGWLERVTETNLYDTKSQDLIAMSQAHDTVFYQSGGKVILGGYAFRVPLSATSGQTYQMQIGRPSATSDGIGAGVFIFAPTNGSPTNGAINALKNVTLGQLKYVVGSVVPFHWFNAGDFGSTNIQNPDIEQVFQSAIYGLDIPPAGSDFFDGMDSCGHFGVYNAGTGYYTDAGPLSIAQKNALFNGDDTTINQIVFGDGQLDVTDVYVSYRRSQDKTLTLYRRFWTNGLLVAETAPNVAFQGEVYRSPSVGSKTAQLSGDTSVTNQPKINFVAGDCQTTAGSPIQIPITANIFGNYPLRMLVLNLTVVPIDNSPALTSQVSFTANPALGVTGSGINGLIQQRGIGNYSAAWGIDGSASGLSNNATIGYLYVTIPTNATSSSAYAIHFDHVSASPNGLATFPKQARTGLITLSNRSGSSYNDGIPDSWRLRYFLTLNNWLSQTNADADGDGMDNLHEYLAGTDPTDPTSCFKNIGTDQGAAQQPQDCVISWPSASGKQYVIERSPSLSTPIWTSIATNSGNGTIMEYHDTTGGGIRYYRVLVQ
jgi:sugar lactone lactonase YvrE